MQLRAGSLLRRPIVVIGAVLAFLVVIGLGLFAWQVGAYYQALKRGEDPYVAKQEEQSVTAALMKTPINSVDTTRIESGVNPKIGNPEAKIHIVEFIDYQCPFSERAAPDVRAFMVKHPDDVLFSVRDFPLTSIHDAALPASIAARCVLNQGDANRFWSFHDLLFRYQDQLSDPAIRVLAETVGADLSAYDACVADPRTRQTVEASYNDGLDAGVRGTPTFFVNGVRIAGALDLAALETIYGRLSATTN